MTPLPDVLDATATTLTAWRIDAQQFAATWDSGVGAERFGGRWNPRGLRVVYCSLDPATCLVESAVHKGFTALDCVPHALSHIEFDPMVSVKVVRTDEVPNPAWLHGGTPSAGQQSFGAAVLAHHDVLVIPSAVSKFSWNLLFNPDRAAGKYRLATQQRLVVDTRLNAAN